MTRWVAMGLLVLTGCGVPEAPGGSSAKVRAQFEAARSAARWHPWGAEEQGRLGMVFAAYQQNEAAAKLFDRARELDATEFRWHYYAAVVHEAAGRKREASERLRAALAINGKYASALVRAGDLESLRKAVRIAPKSAKARYALGNLTGDAAELREAIALFPSYGSAHFALAKLYRNAGDEAAALRHDALHAAHRAAQPVEDDPLLAALDELDIGAFAETRRGFAVFEKGQFDDAARHFRNALEAAPASDGAHAGLIHIAFKTGKWQEGAALYQSSIKVEPQAIYSRLYYAKILEAESKKAESLAVLREALAINPDFGEGHLMAGLLAEDTGAAATQHFREAVRIGANPRESHYLLGRRLFLEGAVDEAIAELRLTLEPVDEKTPRYLLLLASALERVGRKAEAAEFRKRAGR